MKILFITPYYDPDLGPSAPLITMLSEDLAGKGHEITVLCAVPHFPTGTVPLNFRGNIWRWAFQKGVKTCRVWVPSGNRSNLRHRLITFIFFQVLSSLVGTQLSYDAIFITNPALETFFPFVILSWLRRKPAIFGVWDLYPEVGIKLGVFNNSKVIRFIEIIENFCLQRAAAVHILSSTFKANMNQRCIPDTKLVTIHPWIDTEFIKPLPRQNPFSEEHGINDCIVILYAGNLGYSQSLEQFLLMAQRMTSRPDIKFVFVGDGPNRINLVSLSKQMNLDNVLFLPFQPRHRLPEVLSTADIALIGLKRGMGDDSLPSKTFPLLASGRPIIAVVDKDTELWKLVKRSKAGVCVAPDNLEGLTESLSLLASDKHKRMTMGNNGRRYAVEECSRMAAANGFQAVLERIVQERAMQ